MIYYILLTKKLTIIKIAVIRTIYMIKIIIKQRFLKEEIIKIKLIVGNIVGGGHIEDFYKIYN